MTGEARRPGRLAAAVWLGAVLLAFAPVGGARGAVAGEAAAADAAAAAPDEVVFPAVVGEVRFPHSLHADELAFECSDCHHETNAGRLKSPHPEYFEDAWPACDSCHGESGAAASPRACGVCHHASPASTADETLSAKVVIHRSCWSCHDSGAGEAASKSCGFCHADAPAPGEEGR